MTENQTSKRFSLNNYQHEFIQKFLGPNSRPYHLLLAPIGSGKTTVSTTTIQEVVNLNMRKILVLTSTRILAEHYRNILSDFGHDIRIVILDRKLIREIETLDQPGPYWANIIAITSFDTASRDEVRETILSLKWDLVVVDAALTAPDSKRAALIDDIIRMSASRRILMLANVVENAGIKRELGKSYGHFEVTRWEPASFLMPGRLVRQLMIRVVNYERTKEEIEFIQRYIRLSKWLTNRSFQNKIRTRLVSSSLYAAEDSLKNLRNRLAHSDLDIILEPSEAGTANIDDEELLDAMSSDTIDRKFSKSDLPKLMNDLSTTLNALDHVQVDPKFDILLSAIKDAQVKRSHIWTYTAYQSTAVYLHNALSETLVNVYAIRGQIPSGKESESINLFTDHGGVLIASTRWLMGREMPVDTLILYDTPESNNLTSILLSRLSKVQGLKSNEHASIVLLNDISGALTSEAKRLQKFQSYVAQLTQNEL